MVVTRDFLPGRVNDVFTIAKAGRTREILPDGSMLCRDVPIARTGTMVYDASEFAGGMDTNGDPITSPDGVVIVHRSDEDLFDPTTLASFETAPITIGHPAVFVGPDNVKDLSKGSIRHLRRGDGDLRDYLLSDMVIRSRDALKTVTDDRLQEVSPGYDADYTPIDGKPGHYQQTRIIGNHLAIVERGRGGRTVRIGDQEGKQMPFLKPKRSGFGAKILAAIQTSDAEGVEEAIREGADEAPARVEPTLDRGRVRDEDVSTVGENDRKFHDEMMGAIGGLGEKIDGLVGAITKLVEPAAKTGDTDVTPAGSQPNPSPEVKADADAVRATEDEAACMTEEGRQVPTGDAAFALVRQETVKMAEILSPGIRIGTMDAAAPARERRAAVQAIRLAAIEGALRGPHASIVRRYVGSHPVRNMTADAVSVAFRAAGEAISDANRGRSFSGGPAGVGRPNGTASNATADINKRNRSFWNRNKS